MKYLLILSLACLSLPVFANPIDEAVRAVEIEKNAICTHTRSSSFSKCFGIPKTCFYSVKFRCENNDGTFGLKVKVKEVYDFNSTAYRTVVRGTVITK